MFKEKNFGMRCEDLEDGSRVCKRYKKKSGSKLATGTDVQLVQDPQSCKVRFVGDVNDEDREAVEKEAQIMESKCRKGL